MSDKIDFYILASSEPQSKHLFAARLIDKAYKQGLKIFVQMKSTEETEHFDNLLWTFSQNSFIPHTIACNGDITVDRYPVQLGTDCSTTECCDLLVSLTPSVPDSYTRFKRVVDIILNDATDKAEGRSRFGYYRKNGVIPDTHQIN